MPTRIFLRQKRQVLSRRGKTLSQGGLSVFKHRPPTHTSSYIAGLDDAVTGKAELLESMDSPGSPSLFASDLAVMSRGRGRDNGGGAGGGDAIGGDTGGGDAIAGVAGGGDAGGGVAGSGDAGGGDAGDGETSGSYLSA